MERIETLKRKVDALYNAKHPGRNHWAEWLHAHHVFLVADKAAEIARRFGGQEELARAGGMLHHIADALIDRSDARHEDESLELARTYLKESGFDKKEIDIIDDGIRYRGCYGTTPHTLEGKALATADALVYLQSDFYDFAIERMQASRSVEKIREWGLRKVEHDYNHRILFEELKHPARSDYERQKAKFEALK